jgi:lysophospholipase L1-like esterase
VLVSLLSLAGLRADGVVIDSMDEMRFRNPKEKGKAELVEGHSGKAIRFSFEKDCQGVFFTSPIRGQPDWDTAAGFSFWVKGDGSDHFGGLELLYDEDYAVRYDIMFSIKNTAWTKVTVPWRDLIPVLPGPRAKPLNPKTGNKPSKISALWFGKWWYWRDYAAHSYAIDDIRLEKDIALDATDHKPTGSSLQRVYQKLETGKPVTIVIMADSLADSRHWSNREIAWPAMLQKQLELSYRSKVTIHNTALGGTQLRQNVVLIPRWVAEVPEPDLVILCFGGNDWEAGMRGPEFYESNCDAIDRIRRATKGKADVLLATTVPSIERWTTIRELAEACRKAASDRNAGLADVETAFVKTWEDPKELLYVADRTHLSRAGHQVFASTIARAIKQAGTGGK